MGALSSLHVCCIQPILSSFYLVCMCICPASSLVSILRLPFVFCLWTVGVFSSLHVLHIERYICFLVSRVWVLCPPSLFYIFRPTFVSLSLESEYCVLPPYSTHLDLHVLPCFWTVSALSFLHVLHTKTSLCFIVSSLLVLHPPSMFTVFNPPLPS